MPSRHNFKKQFGQNFLKGQRFVDALLDASGFEGNDTYIEIGPGDGMVTAKLLANGARVMVVEIDDELIPKLETQFIDFSEKFHVKHTDVLAQPFSELIQEVSERYDIKKVKIIGSLPYNISKKIITSALQYIAKDEQHTIEKMTFIVQEEVGQAYTANPPKHTFLSASAELVARTKKHESIPASQFTPKPKVNGAIISFTPHNSIPEQVEKIQKCMKIGFSTPRKTLRNNLMSSNKYSKESIASAFDDTNLSQTIRPSELSIDQWISLHSRLIEVSREAML